MTSTSTSQPLTLSETDEAVLTACNGSHGAIEDCEEYPEQVMVAYWVGTLHGHARCGRKFRAEMLEQQMARPKQRQVAA